MKNNKKLWNNILFGIVAVVGLATLVLSTMSMSGELHVLSPRKSDVVLLDWENGAGIFVALLCLGIAAAITRFILVTIPTLKGGVKGNGAILLTFDIISMLMLICALLALVLPVGQELVTFEDSPIYWLSLNLGAVCSGMLTISSVISGIVYDKFDKKFSIINVILFGIAGGIAFAYILSVIGMKSLLYDNDSDPIKIIWEMGGLLLTLFIVSLIAMVVRLALCTIPAIKANKSNIAVLVFDILAILAIVAMIVCIFLPTLAPVGTTEMSKLNHATTNIALVAPGFTAACTLVSGYLSCRAGK